MKIMTCNHFHSFEQDSFERKSFYIQVTIFRYLIVNYIFYHFNYVFVPTAHKMGFTVMIFLYTLKIWYAFQCRR